MIKDKAEANEAGLKYIAAEAALEALEAAEKEAINKIKKDNKARREELNKEMQEGVDALAAFFWSTDERDDGTKGQLTLAGVRLQERKTTEFKYPSPLSVVLDLAKANGWKKFIRNTPEVDKEEIRKSAKPDQLAALKIKVVETTSVYVKAR